MLWLLAFILFLQTYSCFKQCMSSVPTAVATEILLYALTPSCRQIIGLIQQNQGQNSPPVCRLFHLNI